MYQNQNNPQNQQNAQQSSSSSSRSGRTVVPEAKGALNQMKYEIASELGINSSRAITAICRPVRRATSAAI